MKMANKWLYVSLVINLGEGHSDKEVNEIAEDMANIVNNTHSVLYCDKFDTNHINKVGLVNPYLGINYVSIFKREKGKIIPHPLISDGAYEEPKTGGNLTLRFYPMIEKYGKDWIVTILPLKDPNLDEGNTYITGNGLKIKVGFYSLENLNYDVWILAGSSDFICYKYNLELSSELVTYTPLMEDGEPVIERHDHLLIIKYRIEDRIEYAKQNLALDKHVIGHDFDVFGLINFISKKEPDSDWSKAVKKFTPTPKKSFFDKLKHLTF